MGADTKKGAKTSTDVVEAIEILQRELALEYGTDFSFTVHGMGHCLASSTQGTGLVEPNAADLNDLERCVCGGHLGDHYAHCKGAEVPAPVVLTALVCPACGAADQEVVFVELIESTRDVKGVDEEGMVMIAGDSDEGGNGAFPMFACRAMVEQDGRKETCWHRWRVPLHVQLDFV